MEKNDINFSIIIPHYNIPELLMRCLKSIPIREDIQVIVVDDCSPDADTYKNRYPELSRPYLEFYSTLIGGSAGRARNVGLDHAKGKWLLFADADDFFVDDLEHILDENLNNKEDVIYFDFRCVYSDNVNQIANTRNGIGFKSFFKDVKGNENKFRFEYTSPWAKMINHKIVKNHSLRFDETRWANDVFFMVSIGIYAKTIKAIPKELYILTERDGSLTNNFCNTMEELITRTDVIFKVQKLLLESQFKIKLNIYYFLLRIFNQDKKIFCHYINKFNSIGIKRLTVMKNLCKNTNSRRKKIQICRYFILHCLW